MTTAHVTTSSTITKGKIILDGSKSISNRVLIIQALTQQSFNIANLSTSDDTSTLQRLLRENNTTKNTGHAGTTYRFLTAYLALQGTETSILTGSDRMKERPIAPLVDALRSIGAEIDYMEKEGYPPLQIHPFVANDYKSTVSIRGDISSQYISALLLVAPTLPEGLTIEIQGDLVSRPYVEMTIAIMAHFGGEVEWRDTQTLHIGHQQYEASDFKVEADWSAASYYYAIAALSTEADITLDGLLAQSLQGDQAIVGISKKMGIETEYTDSGIRIQKNEGAGIQNPLEYNFIECPDIAQTVSVMVAGVGIEAILSGLHTLKIKETDRIAALQNELKKIGVYFSKLPSHFSKKTAEEYYMLNGSADFSASPTFATYKDHRMAMAFAPLALKLPIVIEAPQVVSKSYPNFWKDLESIGFVIEYQ